MRLFDISKCVVYHAMQVGIAQSAGTITGLHDGQTYKSIRFKNALTGTTFPWMAQNLNCKGQNSNPNDDKENNRKEPGLLYTWEAATKACSIGRHSATDSK